MIDMHCRRVRKTHRQCCRSVRTLRQYSSAAEMSCRRSVLLPKCPYTVFESDNNTKQENAFASGNLALYRSPRNRVNTGRRSLRRQYFLWGGPKMAPFLHALTLPNINRFSILLHCQKIGNNTITKDPTKPQVCRYTTL